MPYLLFASTTPNVLSSGVGQAAMKMDYGDAENMRATYDYALLQYGSSEHYHHSLRDMMA